MKQRVTMMLALVLILLSGWSRAAMAGDHIKVVEWADADGFIITNALLDAINEDLDDDGNFIGPEDRVYELQAGGFYFITDPIIANFPLRLIGEEPEEGQHPAVLQSRHDDAGGWSETMIEAESDLELRNMWILGRTEQGNEGWGLIDLAGENSTVIIDNIVLEYNFSAVMHTLESGIDFYLTNSHFRNLIDHGQYWAGRILRTEASPGKIFVENNTFFNVGHTIIQVLNEYDEFWFNHNTVVNTGRNFVSAEGVQWMNTYIANNLIINGYWHGEINEDFSPTRLEQEDVQYGGWVGIDFLDPTFGFEDQRIVGVLNNVQWVHPDLWDYYDEYPEDVGTSTTPPAEGDVRAADFMNLRSLGLVEEYDNIKFENHLNLIGEDLGLQFAEDGHMDGLVTDMLAWLIALRADVETSEYYWEIPDRDMSPATLVQTIPQMHPIKETAENFTFTHPEALTNATGGYPVGDLNWFPDQKAAWEAERDDLAQQIYDMFEAPPEMNLLELFHAQDGTLGGDAQVMTFDGFEYFHVEGGGVTWTFEMEEGGEYGLDVHHNKFDEGDRGQHIRVNGVALRNDEGFGEYFFPGDQPNNEWLVEEIRNEDLIDGEIVLVEGENTIEITSSWGWQGFHGVDIVDADGDVILSLSIFDGTISGAGTLTCMDEPDGEEAPFCPSLGSWVDFGSGGDLTLNMEFPETSLYNIQLFYILEEGAGTATADILVGEDLLSTVVFEEDTGAIEVAVAGGMVDEGVQGITISSEDGGFGLDRVQVFGEVAAATSSEVADLPQGFELRQNYPNPFNPYTQIEFAIPEAADVRLEVYNLIGQRVAVLVDGFRQEGTHSVQFDGQRLASGVYIYRLQAGNHTQVRKMTLIK